MRSAQMHPANVSLGDLEKPVYGRIAMALDFSQQDERVIANALAQGSPHTEYLLIHIVESASARYFGKDAHDFETQKTRNNSILTSTSWPNAASKPRGNWGTATAPKRLPGS